MANDVERPGVESSSSLSLTGSPLGGITAEDAGTGFWFVRFPKKVTGKSIFVSLQGKNISHGSINAVPCGGGVGNARATSCSANDNGNHVLVGTYDENGDPVDRPFYIMAVG
ncbi:MAG TPA: hypothetical protein VF058_06125 [Actinomycetota bacterium]